jgi:hypothetical protein
MGHRVRIVSNLSSFCISATKLDCWLFLFFRWCTRLASKCGSLFAWRCNKLLREKKWILLFHFYYKHIQISCFDNIENRYSFESLAKCTEQRVIGNIYLYSMIFFFLVLVVERVADEFNGDFWSLILVKLVYQQVLGGRSLHMESFVALSGMF